MDENQGFDYSWSGFLDHIECFHEVTPIWILIGAGLFFGTALSLVPQLTKIVKMRSSYGISPIFVAVTQIAQSFIVLNIFCLHNADFRGTLQIPMSRTIPRLMSFCNCFILWFMYKPVSFLMNIFFDYQPRPGRSQATIKIEQLLSRIGTIGITAIEIIFFIPYLVIGTTRGFASSQLLNYGKVMGTVSSVMCIGQYLPQFITTCKLQDSGSLSIATLCIQAPGGLLNTIFMMVGNDEHWTTWLSVLVSCMQQFILLGMCIFFKVRAMYRRRNGTDSLLVDSRAEGDTTGGSQSLPHLVHDDGYTQLA